jgi:hypothetical protein
MTATPGGGANPNGFDYAWTVPAGATNPGNVQSFTPSVAGVYSVIITPTTGNPRCPSNSASGTFTILPVPTATISGSTTYCIGGSAILSVALTGTGPWSITYTNGVTPVTVNGIVSSPYTFTVSPVTTTTYTVTSVTDANCTNTGTGSAVITVNPLPVCSITGNNNVCPGSTNSYTAPAGMTSYTWTVTNGTIMGASNQQTVSVLAPATCGTYTLGLTITNGNGCTSTCSQSFAAVDNTKPVITLTPAGTLGCNATSQAVAAAFGTASVTDNCSTGLTASGTIQPEVVNGCQVSVTKLWTVTDACNNSATASQTVTFNRLSPASIPANGGSTVSCIAAAGTAPTVPVINDACGNPMTPSQPVISPDPVCAGTKTYTYTFTDCAGQSYQWVYTYTISAPTVTMPPAAGSTVACPSAATAPAVPTVTDNCGRTLTPGAGVESPDAVCGGTKTYTFTFTDCAGLS